MPENVPCHKTSHPMLFHSSKRKETMVMTWYLMKSLHLQRKQRALRNPQMIIKQNTEHVIKTSNMTGIVTDNIMTKTDIVIETKTDIETKNMTNTDVVTKTEGKMTDYTREGMNETVTLKVHVTEKNTTHHTEDIGITNL